MRARRYAMKIHFAVLTDRGVLKPLCNSLREGASWTTAPRVATCPDCIEKLRVANERARGSGPAPSAPPRS